jgi:hypothetical protein
MTDDDESRHGPGSVPAVTSEKASLPSSRSSNASVRRPTRWWSGALASAAGLSAYLALLGGGLLALRFWHAGLPVVQAVSAVPLPTLITTALVEIFVPLLALVAAGLVTALPLLFGSHDGTTATHNTDRFDRFFDRFARPGIAVLLACTVPVNVWGITFLFGLLVVIFAGTWMPHVRRLRGISESRAAGLGVVFIFVVASLPVLARQVVEPLNMEPVEIQRPGQPTLRADLVAVRDASVVVARCHSLFVLPTPESMKIENLPSGWSSGTSIFEKLHIGSNRPVKPRPMPC